MPRKLFVLFARSRWLLPALLFIATTQHSSGDFLEQLERKLSLNLFHDQVHLKLSGLLDFEGYFLDQPAPGLIYSERDFLFNPRLTVFLDAQLGPNLSPSSSRAPTATKSTPCSGGTMLRGSMLCLVIASPIICN